MDKGRERQRKEIRKKRVEWRMKRGRKGKENYSKMRKSTDAMSKEGRRKREGRNLRRKKRKEGYE